MPKTAKTKQQVDGFPFLPKSGYGRLLRIKRSRWVVFVARHPSQMNCFGPLCGCGIFGLVKYRHVWERMGSGGPRGPQNRCEACKTSWMCSIHIRSRQSILPTTTKVPVLFVVVWTTWTKQLRNTRFVRRALKNASTCIVIKTKHLLVGLCEIFPQQCDIIHKR